MNIRETEIAIKHIKDSFECKLAAELNLTRVSAPLFVLPQSGLNDDLNGVERRVRFGVKGLNDKPVEIVHSLAKWKRMALERYGFRVGEGLYTDMNAIRRDEDLDNIHSIYVDQWDWEKSINKSDRTIETLKTVVKQIYSVFLEVEAELAEKYPSVKRVLPKGITFITTQELEDEYPGLSSKEREVAISKKHGAVFLMQIGKDLASGDRHDGRAPDYDDWEMNGDILLWYEPLGIALELSSMGIRVDEESLLRQLTKRDCLDRLELDYHKNVMAGKYPYTIGGGIGQSRICMFYLAKRHIGEVQAAIWPEDMIRECQEDGILLL